MGTRIQAWLVETSGAFYASDCGASIWLDPPNRDSCGGRFEQSFEEIELELLDGATAVRARYGSGEVKTEILPTNEQWKHARLAWMPVECVDANNEALRRGWVRRVDE